jgi:hypothetical protein
MTLRPERVISGLPVILSAACIQENLKSKIVVSTVAVQAAQTLIRFDAETLPYQ